MCAERVNFCLCEHVRSCGCVLCLCFNLRRFALASQFFFGLCKQGRFERCCLGGFDECVCVSSINKSTSYRNEE